jgi:hypothetical protein
MDHPTPTSRLTTASTCLHLRHKGMYVTSLPDPDDAVHCGGSYRATAFWCTCTMKGLGPDGQPVNPEACCNGTGRECCAA